MPYKEFDTSTMKGNLTEIPALIDKLADTNVLVRDKAGRSLIKLGQSAVIPLIAALESDDGQVRWEAARALGEIGDPRAATALVQRLEDTRFDVRWLAAEGLIRMGRPGAAALLRALTSAPWDAVWLREGAHHVLRALLGTSFGTVLAPVVMALEGPEPAVCVPVAAHAALEALQKCPDEPM